MSNPLSQDPSQNLLPSTSFSALNWEPKEPNPAVILQSDLLIGHINQNPNIPALTPNPSDSLLLAQIEGSIATIDPNITLPNDNSFDGLTGEAMDIVKEQLTQFAKVPNFVEKMNLAFGESWDNQAANVLTQDWLNGDFSLIPPVKFVSSAEIGGANGAFAAATDTIYLSRELLTGNGANPATVADMLLEEIGHSVDSRLNVTDTPGDEGAIFAAVVQGKVLSEGELQGLRGEDDRGTVVLGGENTTIEMSQQQWTIKSYTDWRNQNFNWKEPNKTSYQSGNRQDGKDGIDIDWRIGSPFDPPNLEGVNNPDYFATFGYTKASFEAGGTYKFRVSADDGILIGVQQVGQSNKTYITPPSQDGKAQFLKLPWEKEYSWSPTQTGEYYVFFHHYEETGNAGVDISWDKVNGSYSPSPDPNLRVDNDFVERNIGKTQGGNDRRIAFERINSPGYIENRPTWVIIHGWNGKAGDLKDLGQAIEGYDGYQIGDQVLTLDWDAARTGATSLNAAGSWITTVGEKAAETLNGWGINSSNINLVGHSLGTYVAAEIAKKIPGGVNKLIALDPAATTLGGYQEGQVNFSDNSKWSWAFYGSAAGNFDRAYTAKESFEFYFLSGADDNQKHGDVVKTFAKMLDKNNKGNAGYISKQFNLNMMNESALKTWGKPGDGYEATISVTNELEPYRLTHKNGSITESILLV
jgi:pimeloyl-ACP methyl ester carboxylesterase